MNDKILVAVDHSKLSDRAVLAARDLAVLSQGEVWILHLREREVGFKTGATIMDGLRMTPLNTPDEPTSGLDPLSLKCRRSGLRRTRRPGW